MTNHIHLILKPSTENSLQKVLKPLHMRYAQYINKKKNWSGHLWQGRYFSSALDEQYTYHAFRYIENNPVRAKMVNSAVDYRYSSAASLSFCLVRREQAKSSLLKPYTNKVYAKKNPLSLSTVEHSPKISRNHSSSDM